MLNTKRQIRFLFLFFLISTMLPSKTLPEFYRYINKEGKSVFVDDKSKIPTEYLEELKTYKEKYDHLTEEQRATLLEKQRLLEQNQKWQENNPKKSEEERSQKKPSQKQIQTNVVIDKNRVLVPVALGYKGYETQAVLILDTGASISALHQETAKNLHIQSYKRGKMRVVGGNLVDTGIVKLDYIKVGPLIKKDLYAGIIKYKGPRVPYNGLLGMNFLRGLEFSIDYENKLIIWKLKSE